MAKPKGSPKVGGRQKGTPNANVHAIRTMIVNALDKAGGEDYLTQQARDNPVAFMSLIGRVLPKEVNVGGQDDNPIRTIHRIELIPLTGDPQPRLINNEEK